MKSGEQRVSIGAIKPSFTFSFYFASQGQLVYALLYSLHMVQVAEKVSRQEYLSPRMVTGACLMALELSQYRTVSASGTIKLSEHNWLLKLENMMCEYLRNHPLSVASTLHLYLDAYKQAPDTYFDTTFPLTHIETLLELCRCEALRVTFSEGRRDDVLQLCASVLSYTHGQLGKFTLPTSSPFDIFIDSA